MPLKRALIFETSTNTYTAADVLGEGGAGRVYSVIDEEGRAFALKILHTGSTVQRRRFKNEIAFCSKNSSPHIIAVIDYGFTQTGQEKCPFYVMPIYGGTLRRLMSAQLSHDAVLPCFSQILDGVEAAHLQGIVHRDLKPENVLYESSSKRLVVADFGIAQFTEETLYTAVETKSQERLASFVYAAPEQRARGREVSQRADIYALGLILNEMFTGEVVQGTGHKKIGSVAPTYAYLDGLVEWMVRQSPDDRPSSLAEIKRELIARGNEFVSQQRLSELRCRVVPETEVENPIADDPIRPVGVDYGAGGLLIFELNRIPPVQWTHTFRALRQYAGIVGCEPHAFRFDGNRAIVSTNRSDLGLMQVIANHFKNYVQFANEQFSADLAESQRRNIEAQKKSLRDEIQRTESLQRMREAVKSIKL
jgi:serine/threonine protein kinase